MPDPDLNNQPIPFITNSTPAILHPNQYGFFTIKAKDEFKLTCADTQFVAPVAGVSEITVKCISTSYLEFENRQYQFDRFRCKHIPRPKVVITHQRCQSDEYKVTHVGFETKSAFLILYKLCFDPEKLVSTYGWYHVYSPQYKNRQITMVKPNYPKSQNYGKWDLDMLYWNQVSGSYRDFPSSCHGNNTYRSRSGKTRSGALLCLCSAKCLLSTLGRIQMGNTHSLRKSIFIIAHEIFLISHTNV